MSTDQIDSLKELEKFIDSKEDNIEELQQYANKNDVILLAFIGTYYSKRYNPSTSASATFNIRDEFGIEKALTEIAKKVPECKKKKLFLLVNSVGGSLSSAYKISRAIRDFFEDITVFAPHYALSGGTMLALTGDRIRLGMMSQLSPLDVQLFYNEQQVSVNSLFTAQDTLNEIFSTSKPEELPYPYTHLATSLDPIILAEWTGIKLEGRHYLKEILQKSKYNQEMVDDLTDLLTNKFPTHGFVIQYDLADEMGLKVEKHDVDLESWNMMRFWLANYINKQTDRHFIRYFVPKTVTDNAKQDTKT